MARAAAFGVVTVALTTGAHVSAGGAMPSMMVLTLLTVPLMMASLVLAGRRCGPVLLLCSLATAQVALHETLMALTAHVPVGMLPGSEHSSSAMGGGAAPSPLGRSVTMQVAHLLATLVTALLLARGEQALWRLAARLLPALPGEPVLLGCRPLQPRVLFSLPALRPSVVSGGPGLRGPPLRFVAAA